MKLKLLIVTQTVDTEDPVLGFFCRWVEEFAKRVESVEVICLKEGKHALPVNVRVHSLGKKESSRQKAVGSRIRYTFRFLSLAWKLRKEYDAVFVHMNQEYIVIAGWLWKLLGKRVYMWRNYHGGNFLTDIAMAFCTKVFCTSRYSYTAKNKKTELMPVGVDTERFFPDARIPRIPRSILFLSGMWPSKRPEVLVDALAILAREGQTFTADFYGSPLPETRDYYEKLKEKVRALGLASSVTFYPGPPNYQTPDIFRAHEIFVNCSPSGMFDKTLFEAAACGALVVASSVDFALLAGQDTWFDSAETLAARLALVLGNPASHQAPFVAEHSLAALAEKLAQAIH
ncbi:MAG: glycosyltransferase family 4 protein [Candidatus Parcubacteria bacterium]|nr:glycosyltransferase family 4 protein [Candidatus Parcubacteria bacterium]